MFENQDCMKRFGLPRSQEDHDLHMSTFPEDFQKTRRAWLSRVATVTFATHLFSRHRPTFQMYKLPTSALVLKQQNLVVLAEQKDNRSQD